MPEGKGEIRRDTGFAGCLGERFARRKVCGLTPVVERLFGEDEKGERPIHGPHRRLYSRPS